MVQLLFLVVGVRPVELPVEAGRVARSSAQWGRPDPYPGFCRLQTGASDRADDFPYRFIGAGLDIKGGFPVFQQNRALAQEISGAARRNRNRPACTRRLVTVRVNRPHGDPRHVAAGIQHAVVRGNGKRRRRPGRMPGNGSRDLAADIPDCLEFPRFEGDIPPDEERVGKRRKKRRECDDRPKPH